MDLETQSPQDLIPTAPGLSFNLSTRTEAFCPSCGYGISGVTIRLLAFSDQNNIGSYCIAMVCSKCCQLDPENAFAAAASLNEACISDSVSVTHGCLVWTPTSERFRCHTSIAIINHLLHGTALPTRPSIYINPRPPAPRSPQHSFHYGQDPNPNEPPDYDPPCPADIENSAPH